MIFPGVQLAQKWEAWPEAGGPPFWFSETKMDGYRLSACIDADGEVTYYCREPEPPEWAEHLEHFTWELQELGLRNVMLDGEVMAADWNETSKLLRRKRADMEEDLRELLTREVKFHVFDLVRLDHIETRPPVGRQRKPRIVHPVPQHARRQALELLLGGREPGWAVQLVRSVRIESNEQLFLHYDLCIAEGFEGVIVKHPDAVYTFNDRTDGWLKIKPHESRELTIVGLVEGEGKHAGRLGALTCVDHNGQEISVGTGFDDATREAFWRQGANLLGCKVEIRQQVGKVAKSRHPVFVRLRDLG